MIKMPKYYDKTQEQIVHDNIMKEWIFRGKFSDKNAKWIHRVVFNG